MLDLAQQTAVIGGLQRGSRDAWTALYDAYSEAVWRYVGRLLGADAAAVCDVVQETFLTAARSAHNFDSDRGTLWNWLTGIAHHQATAHWRQVSRVQRLRTLVELGAADIHHLLNGESSDHQPCEQRELADLVRGTLAELPADYASLLTAKYLDDQTLEQLSAEHSLSVDAVKSKLARARREFRTKFQHFTREPTPSLKE